MRYHFSVDDVFASLVAMSDAGLSPAAQPMLGFLDRLHAAFGTVTDLYVFQTGPAGGAMRDLAEITPAAADRLRGWGAVRLGPHARDYATPPHAQTVPDLIATMDRLAATIAGITTPAQRARWLRLHYFSESHEARPVWDRIGVTALMTTDKPAVAYRLDDAARAALAATGRARAHGMDWVQSHLRLETYREEAADPARFCARIDAVLDRHGFVTLFTHEVDLADPRVRRLAQAALGHLARRGAAPI
ncbi:MAG: hypothetical protein ACK4TB_11545 [Gemmobacter sp.]